MVYSTSTPQQERGERAIKVRDNSKCREWERRRRDRQADAFKLLAELLPNYDPAKIPARIEILDNATQFIKELRLSNSRLVADQNQPVEMVRKINHLQDEVNKLILRVKQLTSLLVKAKISIPNGPSIKSLGKKRLKWSNKLAVENIENIQLPKKSQVPVVEANKSEEHKNARIGKTKITVVERLEEVQTVKNPASTNSLPPAEKAKEKTNVISAETDKTIPKVQIQQPPTFILTPVQIQPQLITRLNLAPPVPQCQPILSKVVVASSSIGKIPIKSITKTVQKKIRKPCVKGKRLNKKKDKVEFGTQTSLVDSSAAVAHVPVEQKEATDLAEPTELDDNVVPQEISVEQNQTTQQETSIIIPSEKDSAEPTGIDVVDEMPGEPVSIVTETVETETNVSSVPKVATARPIEVEQDLEHITKENVENKTGNGDSESYVKVSESLNQIEVANLVENVDTVDTGTIVFPPPVAMETASTSSTSSNDTAAILEQPTTQAGAAPDLMSTFTASVPSTVSVSHAQMHGSHVHPEGSHLLAESSHVHRESSAVRADTGIPPSNEQSPAPMSSVPVTRVVDFDMDLTESRRETPLPSVSAQEVNEPVSLDTEKMSECIARSIGLMEEGSEETEAELMELGTDWGDVVGHSPKSPISPTQMFLSMFPLLPRESLVAVPVPMDQSAHQTHPMDQSVHQTQDSNPHNQQSSQQKSCRSSFFIDSMLPGQTHQQQATPVMNFDPSDTGGSSKNKRPLADGDSLDTILAPLQPLSREKRSSEILSLSAFLHSEDAFGLEPIPSHGKEQLAPPPPPSHVSCSSSSQIQTLTYPTPTVPTGSNSTANSGFFQTHDLFFPGYNQHKSNEPISTSYLPHHFTNTPNSHGGSSTAQDSTYSFRHKYVETGMENMFPQPQRYVTENQPHQKKHSSPVSHQGKSRTKTLGGAQLENKTGNAKYSPQKGQANSNRDPDPSPFRYFHLQPNAQFRTNNSEQRTESSNCLNSNTGGTQPQLPTCQIPIPPTTTPIQTQFYSTPFQTPSTSTGAEKSPYINERLGRPFYAPPVAKDPPPFYLAPPHAFQPQRNHSSGNLQFSQDGFCNSSQPSKTQGQGRVYHGNNMCSFSEHSQERNQGHGQAQGPSRGGHSTGSQQPPTVQRINQSAPSKRNLEQKKVFTPQIQPPTQAQRPVNWMTDSAYKKGNEFSVSKLVGVQNTNHTDAVVRQNRNPWGDVLFDPNAQARSSYPPPQPQVHSSKSYAPPPQSHGVIDGYDQRAPHSSSDYHSQHHQNYFNPTHHQPHQPYTSGPTSNSISNFNLSSIFPEINDKGQQQGKGVCPTYYANRK